MRNRKTEQCPYYILLISIFNVNVINKTVECFGNTRVTCLDVRIVAVCIGLIVVDIR